VLENKGIRKKTTVSLKWCLLKASDRQKEKNCIPCAAEGYDFDDKGTKMHTRGFSYRKKTLRTGGKNRVGVGGGMTGTKKKKQLGPVTVGGGGVPRWCQKRKRGRDDRPLEQNQEGQEPV